MKNISYFIAVCSVFWAMQVMAADEYLFNTPDAWQEPAAVESVGDSLVVTGQKMLTGKKLIKVPEGRQLKICGTFRAAAGTENNTVYIGFRAYDANRREFQHIHVHPIAGTDTVLSADAKAGDCVIQIADGAAWKKGMTPVWGSSPDKSDLPNYNLLPVVAKVEQVEGAWKITLASALKKDLAKDTGIRTHEDGGYLYFTFMDTLPGATNPPHNTNKGGVWPQTHYVRLMVLANWKGGANAKLEMKSPKVVIVDSEK